MYVGVGCIPIYMGADVLERYEKDDDDSRE